MDTRAEKREKKTRNRRKMGVSGRSLLTILGIMRQKAQQALKK